MSYELNVTAAVVTDIDLLSVTAAVVTDNCCQECGYPLPEGKRSDTRFCGQNCRKQASRRKDRIRRMASKAIAEIETIKRFMNKYPDCGIVAALELERIASVANVTLAAVTDKQGG